MNQIGFTRTLGAVLIGGIAGIATAQGVCHALGSWSFLDAVLPSLQDSPDAWAESGSTGALVATAITVTIGLCCRAGRTGSLLLAPIAGVVAGLMAALTAEHNAEFVVQGILNSSDAVHDVANLFGAGGHADWLGDMSYATAEAAASGLHEEAFRGVGLASAVIATLAIAAGRRDPTSARRAALVAGVTAGYLSSEWLSGGQAVLWGGALGAIFGTASNAMSSDRASAAATLIECTLIGLLLGAGWDIAATGPLPWKAAIASAVLVGPSVAVACLLPQGIADQRTSMSSP